MARPPEPLTHIVAKAGDKKALCGLKKPLPYVGAHAVEAHVRGHDMKVCPKCWELWPSALVAG